VVGPNVFSETSIEHAFLPTHAYTRKHLSKLLTQHRYRYHPKTNINENNAKYLLDEGQCILLTFTATLGECSTHSFGITKTCKFNCRNWTILARQLQGLVLMCISTCTTNNNGFEFHLRRVTTQLRKQNQSIFTIMQIGARDMVPKRLKTSLN